MTFIATKLAFEPPSDRLQIAELEQLMRAAIDVVWYERGLPPKFIYLGRREQSIWRMLIAERCSVKIGNFEGAREFMGIPVLFCDAERHLAVGD